MPEGSKKKKGKKEQKFGDTVPRGYYQKDPNKDVHPRDVSHPSGATNHEDTLSYLRQTDISSGEDPMRNWSINPREWEAVGKDPGSTAGYYYTNSQHYDYKEDAKGEAKGKR